MKNFKIAMMLVAAIAFMCSCGGELPTIELQDANEMTEATLQGAEMNIALTINIAAEQKIETLAGNKLFLDANDTVIASVTINAPEEAAQQTEYTWEYTDLLKAADFGDAVKVVYEFNVTDAKANTASAKYTVTKVGTSIDSEWSELIVLANAEQTGASYQGIAAVEENTTIGVHAYGQKSDGMYYARPTTGASWVFVENDEFTTAEALEAAFNAEGATVITESDLYEFPTDEISRVHPYAQLFFICHNAAGEYVLVKYVAGNSGSAITNRTLVFQYKK